MSGICLSGCRTARNTVPATPANITATTAHSFHALHTQSLEYKTLSTRLHIALATGTKKSFSSRASLKILRDHKLQISIQPLAGIEVMRIEFSPDSVKMLDRMNKRYLADTFENLKDDMQFAFNFHNLQALFTNRIFLPGETAWPDNAFERFRYEQTPHGFIFRTQDLHGLNYLFISHDEILSATEIAGATHALHLDYASFGPVGEGQPFPAEINAEWRVGDETKGSLAIRYSHIDLDRPVDISFEVPKNYERVGLSQILKLTE
ncbi:MAG: DUF4292 domain-containing protein [Tannerella sp.]|jgi:hypothetical protein|nr:DUF4292 domain-containing protein [Tannerella sp.]